MKEFKVSVIIPTYNRAYCVGEAIESALMQTFEDLEVIVVDDGSTDDTPQVLERFRNKIRVIRQQNSGVSAARNAGILAARGEWIAFLDSDDEYFPDALRHLLEPFADDTAIVARFGNVTFEGPWGQRDLFSLRRFKFEGPAILERPLITVLKGFSPVAFAARRTVLLKAGMFDTRLNIHEDTDLMYRVALMGPCMITPDLVTRAIRKGDKDDDLSSAHVADPILSPRIFVYIFRKLLLSDSLNREERRHINRKLGGAWHDYAEARYRKSEGIPKRFLIKSILADRTLHGVVRSGPALFFGSTGFKWTQGLRSLKRGRQSSFRRSEFGQDRNQ